jgi:hypothetical protein
MSFLESAALSRSRIAEMLGIKSGRGGQLSRTLERLRNLRLIELTIPEKPRSRNQKMRLSEKGAARQAMKVRQESPRCRMLTGTPPPRGSVAGPRRAMKPRPSSASTWESLRSRRRFALEAAPIPSRTASPLSMEKGDQ